MSEPTPNPGETWKLKHAMAPDDVRLRTGVPLREVDFADLRGDVVLVAGPPERGWYPAIAVRAARARRSMTSARKSMPTMTTTTLHAHGAVFEGRQG